MIDIILKNLPYKLDPVSKEYKYKWHFGDLL